MQLDHSKLVKGITIWYVLPLSQHPTDPNKLWHGKVTATFIQSGYDVGLVQVESVEPGYEGCTELVHFYQIKVIEPELPATPMTKEEHLY